MFEMKNYERVSIYINSREMFNLVFVFKDYLEQLFKSCEVSAFEITGDGEILNNFDDLEEYRTITYWVSYYSEDPQFGRLFYLDNCVDISKDELRIFGITYNQVPVIYEYNGQNISMIQTTPFVDLDKKFNSFMAHPISVLIHLPYRRTNEKFEDKLKTWVELGSEFFEDCVDFIEADGYQSYLAEPVYDVNRATLDQLLKQYMRLIKYIDSYGGNISFIQPYFIATKGEEIVILRLERSGVGIYYPQPCFKSLLN